MKHRIISPFFLDEILEQGELKVIRPGQYLYYKGDVGCDFFIVLKGQIELSIFDYDGNEVIIEQIAAGGHFGGCDIFTTHIRSTNAHATTVTEVIRFSEEKIKNFIRSDPDIAMLVIQNLSQAVTKRIEYVEDLLMLNAYERVSKKIYELSHTLNSRNLHISQQKVGRFLAISRETTNSSLTRLKKLGAIALSREKIKILDEDVLKKQFDKKGNVI